MILTILNSLSVLLCIYVLVSNKYKTDDKRVTLLYICLNIIFMGRLWIVLDPVYIVTLIYSVVNYIAFIALILITSLVKKTTVIDDTTIVKRIYYILRPVKVRYKSIIRYFKHKKYNK